MAKSFIQSIRIVISFLVVLCSFICPFLLSAQKIVPGTYLQFDNQIKALKSDSTEEIILHLTVKYGEHRDNSFSFFSPLAQTSFNTSYARSYNDGPIWKGSGLTQEVYSGFSIKKNGFRLTFLPAIYFSQNSSFQLASINQLKNKYNYQFRKMTGSAANIDFVQRYGEDPFAKMTLGQSEIGFDSKYISLGISTQNFTLGPAQKNHLIMSNSGEGFPFFYIKKPKIPLNFKDTQLGYLEPFAFWGVLKESDYFDSNAKNDSRYINGISIGYELPHDLGITVGFSRLLYKDFQAFDSPDLYSIFFIKDNGIEINAQGDTTKNTGNDRFDQLASAYVQWKIPNQNARLYFEFGKNDFTGPFRWTVTEFEHNRLYTLGFEKLWKTKNGEFHYSYEHTYLPFFKNHIYRATNSTYTHTEARQGFTHNGQLLGPGIGPGSVSDMIDMTWLKSSYLWGISLSRIRFDEDYFTTQLPNDDQKIWRHDTEFSLGGKLIKKTRKVDWGVNATLSYRFNTYFIRDNDKANGLYQFFVKFKVLE